MSSGGATPARSSHGASQVLNAWRVGSTGSSEANREAGVPPDRQRRDGHDDHDGHKRRCRKLLEALRRECPEIVPPPPLPPGGVADPVTVEAGLVQRLAAVAALGAAGIDGPDGQPTAPGVVWVDGDRELFVLVTEVQVALAPGVVAVTIPVQCDQTGPTRVHVSFAVGSPERPLGMVAATEERPRGPRAVVDVWGDALVAFAWQVVLDVAAGTAAHAGQDTLGAFLLPAAVATTAEGLTVLPQARHGFDQASR
jgi:hypothetical protein